MLVEQKKNRNKGNLKVVARRPYEKPALRHLERNRRRIETLVRVVADFAAIALATGAATALRFGQHALTSPTAYGQGLVVWIPLFTLGLLCVGMYDRHRIQAPVEEMRRIIHGTTLGVAVVVVAAFSVDFKLSRLWALMAWAFVLALLLLERYVFRKIVHALRRRGKLARPALIIGGDKTARDLADAVERAPWEGLQIVGFVAVDEAGVSAARHAGLPLVGTLDDLAELVVGMRVVEVLVAPVAVGKGAVPRIVEALDGIPVDLRIAPGLEGYLPSRLAVHPLGNQPLLAIERVELRAAVRVMKRAMDIVLGTALLVMASPVIAALGIVIRLTSSGPMFFGQNRVGLRGREFKVWKMRSMVVDAEARLAELRKANEAEGLLFKMKEDPRVTRVGRLMRATSLDELPQLWNVIKGEMSLVGPRPPLVSEVEAYDGAIRRRLLVKPGITGLWQVSGRHQLSFEDYVRFDLLYVQNWSIGLDISILAKTIVAAISRRGAY